MNPWKNLCAELKNMYSVFPLDDTSFISQVEQHTLNSCNTGCLSKTLQRLCCENLKFLFSKNCKLKTKKDTDVLFTPTCGQYNIVICEHGCFYRKYCILFDIFWCIQTSVRFLVFKLEFFENDKFKCLQHTAPAVFWLGNPIYYTSLTCVAVGICGMKKVLSMWNMLQIASKLLKKSRKIGIGEGILQCR